jgi:hypothetical protein
MGNTLRHEYLVMPLATQIVDAETGKPIAGADILRVIPDIHDRAWNDAIMDRGRSDQNGNIKMGETSIWIFTYSGSGRIPHPNHQIIIWKSGYSAFVFSQCNDNIDHAYLSNREDMKKAVDEIPLERKVYKDNKEVSAMLSGGKVKLYRTTTKKN